MDKKDLSRLKYVILPGKPAPGSPAIGQLNAAYDYWKQFWEGVFAQNKVGVSFTNDFARTDAITMIQAEGAVVGLHLYSFFDLRQNAHRNHGYFQGNHGADVFLEELERQGIERVMSMEYLTVDPAWRKRLTGLSLACVLISLGTRLQRAIGAGASTGIARKDVGVDNLGREVGGIELGSPSSLYNTPVSFMCMYTDKLKELSDPESRNLVETLWQERTDLAHLTGAATPMRLVA